MEELITGYQYCPDHGEFRCVYEFPNNKDKDDIHIPPFTTLTPPPEDVPNGQVPCWDGVEWVLKSTLEVSHIDAYEIPEVDYGRLLPEFVEDQKRLGLWSDEKQTKWEVARAAFLAAQEKQQQELERALAAAREAKLGATSNGA